MDEISFRDELKLSDLYDASYAIYARKLGTITRLIFSITSIRAS